MNAEDRKKGTVVWFNDQRGIGFIKPDGEEKDIFCHYLGINMSGFKKLETDQRVSFNVGSNDKGLCAINIEVVVNEKT